VLFGLVTSLVSGIQCIVLPAQALSLRVIDSLKSLFLSLETQASLRGYT